MSDTLRELALLYVRELADVRLQEERKLLKDLCTQLIQTTWCRPTHGMQTVLQWPWLSPNYAAPGLTLAEFTEQSILNFLSTDTSGKGGAHARCKGVHICLCGVP